MKNITSLLLFISIITINAYSQTFLLDNTFGQNGITIFQNTSCVSFLDFDTHGNIIAVGYASKGGGKYDLAIGKTNANGIIDTSFGNNGLAKVTDYDNIFPIGMKITSDNKIVVIGSFTKIQFQGYETIIMRFNENGSVDGNFGDNGKVNLNFNTGEVMSLNMESDDFILIARTEGETVIENGNAYFNFTGNSISKYSYNGELDESFGENGKTFLKMQYDNTDNIFDIYPYCIKILNDNSIFIVGCGNIHSNHYTESELAFCKLTANGELDTNFANGGFWHLNTMQDFDLDHESFSNVLEDSEGNLVLTGEGKASCGGRGTFLSKFSSNGVLDTSFGNSGFYCSNTSNRYIFQIADKYLVCGWSSNNYKFLLVNNNGTEGYTVYTPQIYYVEDIKLQGTSKVVLGGGDNTNGAKIALERITYGDDSSVNTDYENDLIIFPNPAKEILYFSNETTFEIIDIQGRILLNSTIPVKSVNIGILENGVYFIRVNNNIQKFVKI